MIEQMMHPLALVVGLITLAVAGAADGEARRLTFGPGDDDEPCFSPDGRWVAYQSRDPSGKPDLWIVGSEGGRPRRITSSPGYNCFPTWSPNGKRIVFASDPARAFNLPDQPQGDYDLYAIDLAEGRWSAPKPLTQTPAVREYLPAYSPDGQWLAFNAALPTRYRLGDNGIFIMAAQGEQPKQTTSRGVQTWLPEFTFDYAGRQLITSATSTLR